MQTSKKQILVIYTGGTIGMVMTPNGYAPDGGFLAKMQAAQAGWPAIGQAIDWHWLAIDPPIDSANMTPAHWLDLRAQIVAASRQHACDGILVLHGTDTLAYTAAALAFLLRGLSVPVVLTGAMRPADRVDTDAWSNLFGAMLALRQSLRAGVYVYFHGRLLPGSRVTKLSADQHDAFQVLRPVRTCVAAATLSKDVRLVAPDYRTPVREARLAVVPLYPGLSAEMLAAVLACDVDGVVLECYGTGTGPSDDAAMMRVLRQAVARGVVLVGISQCPAGAMAPGQYAAGSALLQAGVLPSASMTREAALGKLFCLLGAGLPADELAQWWQVELCGEHGGSCSEEA